MISKLLNDGRTSSDEKVLEASGADSSEIEEDDIHLGSSEKLPSRREKKTQASETDL